MAPRTMSVEGRPCTYGLKLRTNAGSPEPVATRQRWAAAAGAPAAGTAAATSVPATASAPTARRAKQAAPLMSPPLVVPPAPPLNLAAPVTETVTTPHRPLSTGEA